MPNQIRITENVTGKMLASSMIMAHAATAGDLRTKRQFGVGLFRDYLGQNTVRDSAWQSRTKLDPEVVLARASMSGDWLKKAGELIEASTDVRARRSILNRIRLDMNAAEPLHPIKFKMPMIELRMINIRSGIFSGLDEDYDKKKMPVSAFRCSKYPVTNAQYQIFLKQTGFQAPVNWENMGKFEEETASEPVEVKYNEALRFAAWQRRRLLTVNQGLYAAQNELRFRLKLMDSEWEWRKPVKIVRGNECREQKEFKKAQERADADHNMNTGYYSADDFLAAQSFYYKHRMPVHEQNEAAFRVAEPID